MPTRAIVPMCTGSLVWAGLTLADLPANPALNYDGLETLLKSSPWLVLVVITVRWFMNYIEQKDKLYAEIMTKKDEDFLALVRECQTETRTYGEKILNVMDRALATIEKIGNKN